MFSNGIVEGYDNERYITNAYTSNGKLVLVDNASNTVSTEIKTGITSVSLNPFDGILSITDANANVHSVATNYAVTGDKPYVYLAAGFTELATLSAANALSIDTISEATAAAGVTIDGVIIKDGGIELKSMNLVSASASAPATVSSTHLSSIDLDGTSTDTAVWGATSGVGGTDTTGRGFLRGNGDSGNDTYILPAPVLGAQLWITNDQSFSAGDFVVKVHDTDPNTGARINGVLSEVSIPRHRHAHFMCVSAANHSNNHFRCNWVCEMYSPDGLIAPGICEKFRTGARLYHTNASAVDVKVLKIPQINYTSFAVEVTVEINGSNGCASKQSKFIWRVNQCGGAKNRNATQVWTTSSMDMNSSNRTIASISAVTSEETIDGVDHEVLSINTTHGGAISFTNDCYVSWRALSSNSRVLNYTDPNL